MYNQGAAHTFAKGVNNNDVKKRIKIDSSILSFIIILTGFLYLYPSLYGYNRVWDMIFDCYGLVLIIKGNLLRMSSRGHKKAQSEKGSALVTSGPYTLVRNPMYLGSFSIGAGFVFLVWPWWSIVIFAGLFFWRFNKQMVIEEEHLLKLFGEEYEAFCKKSPRIFPNYKKVLKTKTKTIFNLDESFNTKEWYGLPGWIILAFALESFQELLFIGTINISNTFIIFLLTAVIFSILFWWFYKNM